MDPQAIMQKDAALLEHIGASPILHLYEWNSPCLTYGHFVDPAKYLNLEGMQKHGIQMARRPTGGGIIFHLTDLAFSILIPAHFPHFSLNTLENYAWVNRLVAQALMPFLNAASIELLSTMPTCVTGKGFCMARPTQFDLVVRGYKLGGAAQRRTKYGLLHQGSLSLALPPWAVLKDIVDEKILEAMQKNTYALLPEERAANDLLVMRQKIQNALKHIILQPIFSPNASSFF
jgi:lipoate-protein ligase A